MLCFFPHQMGGVCTEQCVVLTLALLLVPFLQNGFLFLFTDPIPNFLIFLLLQHCHTNSLHAICTILFVLSPRKSCVVV